jgi:hypothetical protein
MANGSHKTGPIVSKNGFKVGTKASNVEVIDDAGNVVGDVYAGTNKMVTNSQTVAFAPRAAGTWTGDILVPARAVIENIIVHSVALVNAATSAAMDVGDYTTAATPVAIDANGFFAAIDLKATDLLAGESIDFYRTGGKEGVYLPYTTDGQNAASHINARVSAVDRYIRGSIATVGAATTGDILMTVVYSIPVEVAAVKTA